MTNVETVYITSKGDMLDAIVEKHYGFRQGALELVLKDARNRHLANCGLVLDGGITVTLPVMPVSAVQTTVALLG